MIDLPAPIGPLARAPSVICSELETVRARRTHLDLIARRQDLTPAQDREWQETDQREDALTAELHDWFFVAAGLTMDRLREAVS